MICQLGRGCWVCHRRWEDLIVRWSAGRLEMRNEGDPLIEGSVDGFAVEERSRSWQENMDGVCNFNAVLSLKSTVTPNSAQWLSLWDSPTCQIPPLQLSHINIVCSFLSLCPSIYNDSQAGSLSVGNSVRGTHGCVGWLSVGGVNAWWGEGSMLCSGIVQIFQIPLGDVSQG